MTTHRIHCILALPGMQRDCWTWLCASQYYTEINILIVPEQGGLPVRMGVRDANWFLYPKRVVQQSNFVREPAYVIIELVVMVCYGQAVLQYNVSIARSDIRIMMNFYFILENLISIPFYRYRHYGQRVSLRSLEIYSTQEMIWGFVFGDGKI